MQLPKYNLRIPGPTPCPDDVLEATAGPMVNHRGPEFRDLIFRVTDKLKKVFQTDNDLFIFAASGTGALEAAIVNTLSPGDKVLSASVGSFGDRFAAIAKSYGAEVIKPDIPWGEAVDPTQVGKILAKEPDIKAVLVTHNETSTGVTNNLPYLFEVVKGDFGKLLLVDAVSSMGCIPLPTDEWGCDVVATASQKGFMTPPGLAFASVSADAWKAYETAKMPRFYFDFAMAKRYLERGQTPATPALSLMYGLDLALDQMLDEGLQNIFLRHDRLARMVRERVTAMGLKLLANHPYASSTVTAIWLPDGVDGSALVEYLRAQCNVVVAGGQGKLDGKIFRIGHMGYVNEADLEEALSALERALQATGYRPVHAAGG